jgi:hypothetical protein
MGKGIYIIVGLYMSLAIHAQTSLPKGTWALDSVQVREILADSRIEHTVLPDERWKFDDFWMKEFSIRENENIIYCTLGMGAVTDAPCRFSEDGSLTVEFTAHGAQNKFALQRVTLDRLELSSGYRGTHRTQPIQGTCLFFYHRTALL